MVQTKMNKTALIAGVTGLTGHNLANHLAVLADWKTYGLSRKLSAIAGVDALAADLLDLEALKQTLKGKEISHLFFTSWQKMESEERNCEVNGVMLKNLLAALSESSLSHVALVTGGKNYFGSFAESGKYQVVTPYREEQRRKPGLNFYYTQEDILFEQAKAQGFSWSVHRPDTVVGFSVGNLMNMGTTLAAYAAICRETGMAFTFPGSPTIYNGVCDVTDARLLARHLTWSATTDLAKNQAFNVVNGDVFRWSWMWQQLADYFQVEVGAYPGHENPLENQMREMGPVWSRIIEKYDLVPTALDQIASWWHTDSDLSRPFETFADMSKSRKLGFLDYQKSNESFFELFDQLKKTRFIPSS